MKKPFQSLQDSLPVPSSLRIVFMGTPDFAVPTLKALLNSPHQVVSVYTQPDRPKGRGNKMLPPPVKVVAQEAGVVVHQPEKLATKECYEQFRSEAPDVAVVVAYGKILRAKFLQVPKWGCINCHASLLPFYRGAAPIFWSVAQGEAETGISTMLMDEGMDTGDILLMDRLAIDAQDECGTIHDELSELSARLLMQTLDQLVAGTLTREVQQHEKATHAPMIHKEHFFLDFSKTAKEVFHLTQALSPFPGAKVVLEQEPPFKVFEPVLYNDREGETGAVLEWNEKHLLIACGKGAISFRSIQWPGKKRMPSSEFVRGKELSSHQKVNIISYPRNLS